MSAAERLRLSYLDYLALEAGATQKHEYLRGEVWAMAGGTPEHGRLQASLIRELGNALAGKPCVVMTSDVRVRVDATDRTTYPDLFVVCGPRRVSAADANAIVNPILIVEVLSEGTEREDRGEKFAHYRRLDSLVEYVLVSQTRPLVEVFRRSPEGWVLSEAGPGSRIGLRSIDASLDVDAVYRDPTLP
jgi:Uma2 family endonuclease